MNLLKIENHIAVSGLRHVGAGSGTPLAGSIEDARIYARLLTVQEIQSLRSNTASTIQPMAWWDFEGDALQDRAGHFTHHAAVGGAQLKHGRLVLDGKGYLVAARSEADVQQVTLNTPPPPPTGPFVPETPAWPDQPPANWVTFHLAHPGPGPAMPGDPNCIFDDQSQVHLHYFYRNAWGFVFGHVSSDDMVLEMNARACELTRKYGMMSHSSWIIGYPGETRETVQETLDFIRRHRPSTVNLAVLRPYPNTEAYEIARSSHMLVGDWHPEADELPWIRLPWAADKKVLDDLCRQVRRQVYFTPHYAASFASQILRHSNWKLASYALQESLRTLRLR